MKWVDPVLLVSARSPEITGNGGPGGWGQRVLDSRLAAPCERSRVTLKLLEVVVTVRGSPRGHRVWSPF